MQKRILLFSCLVLCLAACSRTERHQAQGYVEGRYTYIATPVGGDLTTLAVERGQSVKQGQLLFVLAEQPESDQYRAAIENLKQAQAAREAILPNLNFSRLTYERYQTLVAKKALEKSQLDEARAAYQAYQAQLAQASAQAALAQANLLQAAWTKEQKRVTAPVDALVFDTYYRVGEYTLAAQPVLSLLAPADIKVIFFVQEPLLAGLHLGEKVRVDCNGCQSLKGKISYISPRAEYTPPVIYSNETKAKLIFRVEAEFAAAQAKKLHPGQPVMVTFKSDGPT